jgi:ComF family protein
MFDKMATAVRSCRQGIERGLVDLVFPAVCIGCGQEQTAANRSDHVPICHECLESLQLFTGQACARCGIELSAAAALVPTMRGGCIYCDGRKLWFDATVAAGPYTGRLRELVLRMKQMEGQAVALAIGRVIVARYREQLPGSEPDVVVPVPMHWRRRLSRGANSAAVLAEVVSTELHAPLAEGLLRRRRHTRPQTECTPPQRWDNVRRAFAVAAGYHLNKAHVLLVDDILTTGATCSEAARELRRAGASRVTVVVAARSITPRIG